MHKLILPILLLFSAETSRAQKSPRQLEKIGLRELQQAVSYIPVKEVRDQSIGGSERITLEGFYMGRTEVTNREYRAFVEFVRDSIANALLGRDGGQQIDWADPRLGAMMLPAGETLGGKIAPDPTLIRYSVELPAGTKVVGIYPDTLVWVRDFPASLNETMTVKYFSQPAYDNYPVVGVSLEQAFAFCQWKTKLTRKALNRELSGKLDIRVSLPGFREWEAAASEGRDSVILQNKNGNYLYNFGNIVDGNRITVKSYRDDGFFYTAPVMSYPAGAYQLYDMRGNVAEWTQTPMEEVLQAEVRPSETRRTYVVKGGGWNSAPFELRAETNRFIPSGESHAHIGFRYMVQIISMPEGKPLP
ncbi:MAG: formylglycine-generating enzyme family protein [Chitinophagaceae bacterium]